MASIVKISKNNHTLFNLGSATRNTLITYIHGCGGSSSIIGTAYNFPYSDTREANGATKTWTTPCTGKFKFEAWGASGRISTYIVDSATTLGKGGYASGNMNIDEGKQIFVYVGSQGIQQGGGSCNDINYNVTIDSGYNGGGGFTSSSGGAGGGGATDFRLTSGVWNEAVSLKSRIIVSGGGGATGGGTGGNAGGLHGGSGNITDAGKSHYYTVVTGPSQLGVGSVSYSSSGTGTWNENDTLGGFGYGGHGAGRHCVGLGGGSGYWGGAGVRNVGAAGGGSSYISGYKGCVAIISASSTSPRKNSSGTTCTESLAASDVSCSYHYSGYIFTDTVMKAGNESMPAPGGGNETGHSGNGYARITVVE